MSKGNSRARIACATAFAACALLLQSCFTSALWEMNDDDDVQPRNASYRITHPEKDDGWGLEDIGLRILATPVTLILDLITSPIQAWFDDEEC